MVNFDRILVVDWSASNQPKTGSDSIWIADAICTDGTIKTCNPATRSAAMEIIETIIADALDTGKRLFAGFDFAFGYPVGSDFLPGNGNWKTLWRWLSENVQDNNRNESNRFQIADQLNEFVEGSGPFWGHPHTHNGRYNNLKAKKPNYSEIDVKERRSIDALISTAQPVWKLAYTGSVGSQALLGIARLEALRQSKFGSDIAIWPFETKFADDLSKPIIIGELYPSLFDVKQKEGEVKDCAQVRCVAENLCLFSNEGKFWQLLDGPRNLDKTVRSNAMNYEAWMVGVSDEKVVLQS